MFVSYEDDKLADDVSFLKIANEYKKKLQGAEITQITEYEIDATIINVYEKLENSIKFLELIKKYNSRVRSGIFSLSDIDSAINETTKHKEIILKLGISNMYYNPQNIVPDYFYGGFIKDYCNCELETIKLLLFLLFLKNCRISTNEIKEIALSRLEILQIPLSLLK